MKIIKNIIFALVVFSLSACSRESAEPESILPETRGVMQVIITEQAGTTEDKMETVRFIVFKDISGSLSLELNKRFTIPPVSSPGQEVSKFKIALEVSRKINGENNKTVVAIINEPSEMNNELNAVETYDQLQNIELNLAHFLNTSHLSLQDNKLMPMTGVLLTNKVYATPEEAEATPVNMTVQRAVARIDVYLRKEAGLEFDLDMGTKITLTNTYDKEYLVGYENGSELFRKIQTITSGLLTKTWTLEEADNKNLPDTGSGSGRLVCSFYTPERTCVAANDADKLVLKITVVTNEGVSRSGEVIIDKFKLNGADTDVNAILRNNIYKVITTTRANSITSVVLDWNEEDIHVEF